jgi:hypothetical protein
MSKPGLMKKYIKLAKGDFAKAWRLQKAAQKKKKKPAKKKSVKKRVARKKPVKKKKVVRKKPVKKRVVKRKVVKRTVKRKAVKSNPKKGGRKMARKRRKKSTGYKRRPAQNQIMDKMGKAGLAAAGAVGASIVAARIPLKDKRLLPWIPAAVGAGLMFTRIGKQRAFQPILGGMFAASAFALARQFLPENVPLLAGEDDMLMLPDEYSDPDMMGLPYVPEGMGQVSDAEIDDMIDTEMMGEWETTANYV